MLIIKATDDNAPELSFDDFVGELGDGEMLKELVETERCEWIADRLTRTTNEISFVEEKILKIIESEDPDAIYDGYGDTSVILASTENFAIRVVKWIPQAAIVSPELEREGLSYNLVHNHDFQLVTKGIFGPGYQTDIYRLRADMIAGAIGEDVSLDFLGRHTLETGDVFWYEQSYDVHTQIPPASLSLSLNIIPRSRSEGLGQFIFDSRDSKIVEFARNGSSRTLGLLTMLSELSPTHGTRDLILEIASTSRNDWLKIAAASLISERWNEATDPLWEELKISPSYHYAKDFPAERFFVTNTR